MISIELNASEATVLLELLETDLSDLRMEIAGTDRLAYREMLHSKKAVIKQIIEQLNDAGRSPSQLLPPELHPEI